MRALISALAALALLACGAEGPKGDPGPAGPQGAAGDPGPAGPVTPPPRIGTPVPDWGSRESRIRIPGTDLVSDGTAPRVYFDGREAEVVAFSATELLVQPSAGLSVGPAAVSVQLANQMSNAAAFEMVASGTARAAEAPLPSTPAGAVQVGDALFIASSSTTSSAAGLYRRAANGVVSRVWSPSSAPWVTPQGVVMVYDAPTCLTADGSSVWFATAFGAVYRYSLASGLAQQVLAAIEGGELAPYTGIARTEAGTLLIVDGSRSRIVRMSAAGAVDVLATGELWGAFGIAVDGTDAYLTRPAFGDVLRISSVDGAWTAPAGFAAGASARGIAVRGDDLFVSDLSGALLSVNRTTGGPLAPHLPASVLRYQAWGLSVTPAGAILAAQPEGGAVRSVTGGGSAAEVTIASAGLLGTFGAVRDGDTTYLAMVGPALFADEGPNPPSPPIEDSVLVALKADGTSRLLARGSLFTGLALLPTPQGARLALSDCMARKIELVDPATGARQTLLAEADGLGCPTGLWPNGSNDLFYVDSGIFSGEGATVGRWTADQHTQDLVTGLPANVLFVVRFGGELLMGGMGPTGASGIYWAVASGGTPQLLIPPWALLGPAALAVSPAGVIYAARFGGEIYKVDRANAEVRLFARTQLRPAEGIFDESIFFAMTFAESGALLVPDLLQQEVVAIAP